MCVSCYTHIYIDAHTACLASWKTILMELALGALMPSIFLLFNLFFLFLEWNIAHIQKRGRMAQYSKMFTMETGCLDSGLGFAVC